MEMQLSILKSLNNFIVQFFCDEENWQTDQKKRQSVN